MSAQPEDHPDSVANDPHAPTPSPTVQRIIDVCLTVVLGVALFGLCAFYLAVLYRGYSSGMWDSTFQKQYLAITGAPAAVLIATVVVQFFRKLHGPISVKIAEVEFAGATGPVILWIFSFLATVWGIRYLWTSN